MKSNNSVTIKKSGILNLTDLNQSVLPTKMGALIFHVPTHSIHCIRERVLYISGLYSCRVTSIAKASSSSATLAETVVLTAVSLDGSVQSRSTQLPFAPALYLHQTELKVTYTKPRGEFIISGVPDVFSQMEVTMSCRSAILY